MLTRSRRPAPDRRGFSLIELMVVIVLLGIVMGSILTVVTRQQRFYRGTREVIETRSNVRQGIDVLRAELRGVSSIGGDLYPGQMNETSIEFRSMTGSSMICSIPSPSGQTLIAPPDGAMASGAILSVWRSVPAVGDSVFVYDNGPDASTSDDSWTPIRSVRSVTPLVGACGTTPFLGHGAVGKTGYAIGVQPPLPSTIQPGTPIRFFRRVRYELYQASDLRWYLGYSECRPTASPTCSPLEPVSGPYLPFAVSGGSGIGFYYFDVNGVQTTTPTQVARIDVIVRGQSEQPVAVTGGGAQPHFLDTTRVAVGLRNRS